MLLSLFGKKLSLLAFLIMLNACAAPEYHTFSKYDGANIQLPADKTLYIRANVQDDVPYQGLFDYDDVEIGGQGILYPGDSGGVFLASVITHAVMTDSIKSNAMTKVQEQANTVLAPYQRYIEDFETGELVSSVVAGLDDYYDFNVAIYNQEEEGAGFVLISKPVFYMTQDQRELILKHAMYLHPAGKPDVILFKNFVEISSSRFGHDDIQSYWIDDNNLALASAELYARSVELFVDDALDKYQATDVNQKTFSYSQGGERLYERGTLVAQSCGKTVMRTLRGWLKLFPESNVGNNSGAGCKSRNYVDASVLITLANNE